MDMLVGNRKVTKIIAGGRIVWEKPNWHKLALLDESFTGEVSYMLIDNMILFNGKVSFNKYGVFNPMFALPDFVTIPSFNNDKDIAYLAEVAPASVSVATGLFSLKLDGNQISGKCLQAESGINYINFDHFRMKFIKKQEGEK